MPTLRFAPKEQEAAESLWCTELPIDVNWGIYARQSTPMQVRKNVQSTEMQTDELIQWLLDRGATKDFVALFDMDLGVSGTKSIEERTGMQELVWQIKHGKIRAVLVHNISRLFRDESGAQYNTFAQICKRKGCILVTAQDGMVYNFNNPIHLKMFRILAKAAADYIPQQIRALNQAKTRKSKKGLYAGEGQLPRGYIVDYNEKSKTYQNFIQYSLPRGHQDSCEEGI
jgi:DNA invertase Pin-like site-specific DNA recombinase